MAEVKIDRIEGKKIFASAERLETKTYKIVEINETEGRMSYVTDNGKLTRETRLKHHPGFKVNKEEDMIRITNYLELALRSGYQGVI